MLLKYKAPLQGCVTCMKPTGVYKYGFYNT
jgi:hypothetical protein